MRSALEEVKGVKEVSVSLEKKEAVVKYDPDVVKVEDLYPAARVRTNSRNASAGFFFGVFAGTDEYARHLRAVARNGPGPWHR